MLSIDDYQIKRATALLKMSETTRIAHLDMDAFYASVELLRYPELRGQVVVVGGRAVSAPYQRADGRWHYARLGDYAGRGVVTTSSYEARALGVFSAMGLMKAAQKAPNAILLPANFDAYRQYSRLFKQAVATVSDRIENRGIDEIYIDLSHLSQPSAELAALLQQRVYAATGLSCSIGISPNKLLAKIASDLNKPNGFYLLESAQVPQVVWPLSVAKINGIGPKAQAKLADLGVSTVGQLAAKDPAVLQRVFGVRYARWLLQAAQGIDPTPIKLQSTPKSLSRERTFDSDLHVQRHRAQLSAILWDLCQRLETDLIRKKVYAQTVGIKLRFDDFTIMTRDGATATPIRQANDLIEAARQCLRRTAIQHRRLRLVGVKASNLMTEADYQRWQSQPIQLQLNELL